MGPRFVVPFLRHPGFVGREEDLAKVHALLQKGEAPTVPSAVPSPLTTHALPSFAPSSRRPARCHFSIFPTLTSRPSTSPRSNSASIPHGLRCSAVSNPAFVASLPTESTPTAQLLSDLRALNAIEVLEDGTVPVRIWLMNARTLASSRRESVIFQRALDRISQNPAILRTANPVQAPAATPARPAPRPPIAALPATAAFLSIAALKSMDGPEVQAALSTLHHVLRTSLAPLALPDLGILSSLTGAIVLVPDALNRNIHDLLPTWLRAIAAAGLSIRAGVARGMVEMIADADGTVTAIGRCINVAARLATSDENPGVLYEETYATHVQPMLLRTHFLHPRTRLALQVKGKRAEVFTCFADPDAAPRPTSDVRTDSVPPFVNAVLIAYDLPDFSDGDLRTLASRFRAVVQEVQRLREENTLPDGAGISLSPGGDGGVLSLTQVPLGRAFGLATELASLLEAADTTQAEDAPVRARIGVHYGQVLPYENAEGVARPTGLSLFDADGLAGDAEARRYDTVVVSGALIESAGLSAGKLTASRFQEIAPLVTLYPTTIRRFVPKDAKARAGAVPAPVVRTSGRPVDRGSFLAACTPAAAKLFTYLLDEAVRRDHLIYWGVKGLSLGAQLPGGADRWTFAYGFPRDEFHFYFEEGAPWSSAPESAALRKELMLTTIFREAGRLTLKARVDDGTSARAHEAARRIFERVEESIRPASPPLMPNDPASPPSKPPTPPPTSSSTPAPASPPPPASPPGQPSPPPSSPASAQKTPPPPPSPKSKTSSSAATSSTPSPPSSTPSAPPSSTSPSRKPATTSPTPSPRSPWPSPPWSPSSAPSSPPTSTTSWSAPLPAPGPPSPALPATSPPAAATSSSSTAPSSTAAPGSSPATSTTAPSSPRRPRAAPWRPSSAPAPSSSSAAASPTTTSTRPSPPSAPSPAISPPSTSPWWQRTACLPTGARGSKPPASASSSTTTPTAGTRSCPARCERSPEQSSEGATPRWGSPPRPVRCRGRRAGLVPSGGAEEDGRPPGATVLREERRSSERSARAATWRHARRPGRALLRDGRTPGDPGERSCDLAVRPATGASPPPRGATPLREERTCCDLAARSATGASGPATWRYARRPERAVLRDGGTPGDRGERSSETAVRPATGASAPPRGATLLREERTCCDLAARPATGASAPASWRHGRRTWSVANPGGGCPRLSLQGRASVTPP